MNIRAFLGGSFDPIHQAHIQMAMCVWQTLHTHYGKQDDKISVSLLPTAGNPFKGNPTSHQHRLAMIERAIDGLPLTVETYELSQTPPVYTIDTACALRQAYPDDLLIFIVGQDSLASLPKWKDGERLFDLLKFWAFTRLDDTPNAPLNLQINEQILAQCTDDLGKFFSSNQAVYLDKTPINALSSSQIRQAIKNHNHIPQDWLNPAVLAYIHQHQLYQ